MKDTPLTPKHEALGAKLVEFAGFRMPVQYEGVNEEHHAVRERAGIFDVSHMGEFIIEGPQALDLIQKVTSNDASQLVPGKAQYSCMPNLEGGIVDDLIIYMLDEERYMFVVNAANIEKDREWILSWNEMDARLDDQSDQTSLIALQGPQAHEILGKLTDKDINAIRTWDRCQPRECLDIRDRLYRGERIRILSPERESTATLGCLDGRRRPLRDPTSRIGRQGHPTP